MATYTPAAIASAGQVLTASEYNKRPRGAISYVENTTLNQSASTSGTDITSLTTGSISVAANRLYRISCFVPAVERNGAMSFGIRLMENSSVIQYSRFDVTNIVAPCFVSIVRSGLAAGSYTWKAQVVILAGSGTWTVSANGTTGAAWILVEDIGQS